MCVVLRVCMNVSYMIKCTTNFYYVNYESTNPTRIDTFVHMVVVESSSIL